MKKNFKIAIIGAFLLTLGASHAFAVIQPQTLLPGNLIPKFVDPLPVAGDISVINATSTGTPAYTIHMREFKAQILPSTGVPAAKGLPNGLPANTASSVWGYLTDTDVAALTPTTVRPSYLGPVVVAERHVPAYPTYLNELPDVSKGDDSVVFANMPFDLTLDWANPTDIDCEVDPNTHFWKAPTCGVVPLDGGPLFPLPDSVHIHGGEVAPAYDGGPDSWFTQDDPSTGVPYAAGIGFAGKTYEYLNGQEEATIWFHPHGFGITRLNVYAGLAGVYPIIDPANQPLADMPEFPTYDIPLIIQDRSFDTNGEIFYNVASNPQPNPEVHPFWTPEFIGDTIVVNGKTWPYLEVEPRQYRFRLLNGSNARFYDLTMSKGVKFTVIATDNGYLKNAVSSPNVIIGPGERYEVIVDFSGVRFGKDVVMKNAARTPFPGGGAPTKDGTDTVMQFRVVKTLDETKLEPQAIVAGTAIRPTPLVPIDQNIVPMGADPNAGGTIVRQLTLNEVIGPGGPLELVVNNSKYNLDRMANIPILPECGAAACRETEFPQIGDTEVWEIINITADAHPMHTHLTSFRLLDRTPISPVTPWINQYDALMAANGVVPGGGPPNQYNVLNADGAIGGNPPINSFLDLKNRRLPLPYEEGWKDTVIMYPGEVTRFVVRFAPQDAILDNEPPTLQEPDAGPGINNYPFDPTDLSGENGGQIGYVWHCHILDHEDNEMMRPYVVNKNRQVIDTAN
jgi:FtsP/CotA-like multicopper oxidase with cupredoxin domain